MLEPATVLTPIFLSRAVRASGTALALIGTRPQNTAVVLGNYVIPANENADVNLRRVYECTTAGTTEDAAETATAHPVWPTTAGEPVTDGNAVWTARPYSRRYAYGFCLMGKKIAGANTGVVYVGTSIVDVTSPQGLVVQAGEVVRPVDLGLPAGACADLASIYIDCAAANTDGLLGLVWCPAE